MEHFEELREENTNRCYWQYSHAPISYSKVNSDLRTEVVIVGEGLAAVTVAYNLVRTGKKVVLVSEKPLGTYGAGRTNSHLVTAIDNRYYRLERIFGPDKTRLIAESHKEAIDRIERTVAELGIDCEFERLDGFLFLNPSDHTRSLSSELKAARNAGVSVTDLPFVLGTNKHIPCLKFHDQAQFHPMKYLKGLSDAFCRAGGTIYTGVGIAKADAKGVLLRNGHRLSADHIVMASEEMDHAGLGRKKYKTYTIAARIRKNSVRKFLWWDTGNMKKGKDLSPYHYVRIQRFDSDYDLLICGGQTHAADNENDVDSRFVMLESWMRERFPAQDVIYRWTAEGHEPSNHVGYIGLKPGSTNVYVVTGDSGHGAMNATIAGSIIPDLINGRKNRWATAYDPAQQVPSRLSLAINGFLKDTISLVKKGAGLVYKYSPGRNIASAVIRDILSEKERKLDVFTDGLHPEGTLYWSNDEESWDRIQQQKKWSVEQK